MSIAAVLLQPSTISLNLSVLRMSSGTCCCLCCSCCAVITRQEITPGQIFLQRCAANMLHSTVALTCLASVLCGCVPPTDHPLARFFGLQLSSKVCCAAISTVHSVFFDLLAVVVLCVCSPPNRSPLVNFFWPQLSSKGCCAAISAVVLTCLAVVVLCVCSPPNRSPLARVCVPAVLALLQSAGAEPSSGQGACRRSSSSSWVWRQHQGGATQSKSEATNAAKDRCGSYSREVSGLPLMRRAADSFVFLFAASSR